MIIKIQPVEDVVPADLTPHPLADLFPMMDDEAFDDFAGDIEKNGQREPIVLFENKILDGRNRFKACKVLNISPLFKEYNGNDALGFVISLNLKRRHLTTSQRAMVAARIANLAIGSNQHVSRITHDNLAGEEFSPPMTVAAKQMRVDRKTGQFAKTVLSQGTPDLIKAVDGGEVSVSLAAEIAKHPAEVQHYVVTPSQEKELSTALKRLQNAKAMKDEADRFVPPPPLSDEEKAERLRVFGTQETRAIVMDVIKAGEMVAKLPSPETVAGFVPAGMDGIITDNINAMREVSKWFDAFVIAWQAKE